jgi:hypothetical protein
MMFMFEYLGQSRFRFVARSLTLSLLAAPLAAGCTDDPPAQPAVVTIKTTNPPALVAFREDAAAEWKALTAAADGTFRAEVPGPYRVVIACESTSAGFGSIEVQEYARTPEDGASIEHACAPPAFPFHVRGTVVQSGVGYLGNHNRAGFNADWALDMPAAAGSYDLVMLTAAGRLGIRRDLTIAGDMELGAIDLPDASTVALVSTPFTVSGAQQGEAIGASTRLDTGSTIANLQDAMSGSGAFTAKLAPESALVATDRQIVIFNATTLAQGPGAQNKYRFLERKVRVGDPTTAALPEPLGPVTFEAAAEKLTAT